MDERVDNPQTEIRHAPLSRGPAPPVVRRSRHAHGWASSYPRAGCGPGGRLLVSVSRTADRGPTRRRSCHRDRAAAGGCRDDRHRRHPHHPERARHRHAAGQRDGARRRSTASSPTSASRKARRSRRATSWPRSTAPVPGRAGAGAGHACTRPGAARPGADRPEALPDAGAAGLDRAAAGGRSGIPGCAVPGLGAVRPGADRQRQAEPRPIATSSRPSPAGSGCGRSMPAITCRPAIPTASWWSPRSSRSR